MAKKIMVVDDSPTIRQAIVSTLQQGGYEVIEGEDGQQGLARLQGETVDLVITDLNMPKMDGIGLIREVRRQPGMRFTPIIMLTTESQEEKKREGKAAGASAWLIKPCKPEQLLKLVRLVLP
jgi:two-component system chemotaxis response regulator CheY